METVKIITHPWTRKMLIVNEKGLFAEVSIAPQDQSPYYSKVYEKFDTLIGDNSSGIITLYEDQTENGIPYTYDLVCDGMMAMFYQFPGVTKEQVAQAKRDLKSNHDVVSISVKKLKRQIEFTMPEREK